MTDLEMTKLCAEAMGIEFCRFCMEVDPQSLQTHDDGCYDPIHNDAQAMALVKRFRLLIDGGNAQWCVHGDTAGSGVIDDDLNRAIVQSVAHMQKGKK